MNTERLDDAKFHQMSVTSHQWPYHIDLWSVIRLFLFFIGTTLGITLGIMSVLQQFSRSHKSMILKLLTADKKLLGAAVLLTSHLFCTPSALEAIPCSSPPSVSLYDGACTPAGSGLEVQSTAELLIKHPVLHGPLILSISGCSP